MQRIEVAVIQTHVQGLSYGTAWLPDFGMSIPYHTLEDAVNKVELMIKRYVQSGKPLPASATELPKVRLLGEETHISRRFQTVDLDRLLTEV